MANSRVAASMISRRRSSLLLRVVAFMVPPFPYLVVTKHHPAAHVKPDSGDHGCPGWRALPAARILKCMVARMASSNDQQRLRGRRPGTVLVPQGPLTRGTAFLIDTLLVSLVVGLLLGERAPFATVVAATLVADFLYFALSEGITGTTLGKRLFGLRVVRAADGRSCGPLAAVVRTALRLVDNLLFSLPGIAAIVTSPRRQRLGDRAARTLVVTEVPEQLLAAFDRDLRSRDPG